MASTTADLVFVTNIPTPYRTAFFNTLSVACEDRGLRLAVLYCARTEPRRAWAFDPAENRYVYSFLPGVAPTIRDVTFPLNPIVNARLAALAPRVVVYAGAWHMPTNLISQFGPSRNPAKRLFWSEAHADAVINSGGPIAALRRRVLKGYDGFVVPNSRSAAWLIKETGDRPIHYLPNTVEEDFYAVDRTSGDERAEARTALGIGANERVLVQVAGLLKLKGTLELARAFAQMPLDARTGGHLVFVGDGELKEQVTSIADTLDVGRITVTGQLQRDGVRRWLAAADGFALNTYIDRNPLSPIEASFAGLPMLLSRRAGNFDEMVGDHGTGFVIEDPASPEEAVGRFFAAPATMLAEQGIRAQANAHANFTRSAIATAFLDSLGLAQQ